VDTAASFRASDGATLGYRIARAPREGAPLLVLIHGLASNLSRWEEFVERTRLRASWDLLRVDLRGHGASFTRTGLGFPRWIEDLRELLEHERRACAVFAGHSLGAHVAARFAARYPERARGLVLLDPVLREALRGAFRLAALGAPLLRAAAGAVAALNAAGLRRRRIPPRDLRALDERARREWLLSGQTGAMVAHYGSALADLRHFPLASYLREVAAMTEPLPPPQALRLPVLVLLSSGITYTDPRRTRALLEALPQGRVETLPAYHWPLTERPDEVRAAIERWCEALEREPGARD
jgi:pimeloyl-ACP methyl ester carboxylesterase